MSKAELKKIRSKSLKKARRVLAQKRKAVQSNGDLEGLVRAQVRAWCQKHLSKVVTEEVKAVLK